jgi:hypothetical protein
MAKKSPDRRRVRKSAAKPKSRKTAAAKKAEDAFAESLEAHGQAAKRRPDGTLPPGATHEITVAENGEKKIVRRRFSIL